ncbi:hypothetical protein [Gottfriedia luciferensis]|uniref:hypothetical protein n=1 Tax=Gottfriedia luciferensis TaxID=178774 RepID=UPI000B43DE3D|nr:hypothetical protein [Gottfriedia luciferensis]
MSELIAAKIMTFFLLIPLYAILLWTYFYPRESFLLGKRWMYNEDPELSDEYIRYTKIVTLIAIVFITIFALVFFFKYK